MLIVEEDVVRIVVRRDDARPVGRGDRVVLAILPTTISQKTVSASIGLIRSAVSWFASIGTDSRGALGSSFFFCVAATKITSINASRCSWRLEEGAKIVRRERTTAVVLLSRPPG